MHLLALGAQMVSSIFKFPIKSLPLKSVASLLLALPLALGVNCLPAQALFFGTNQQAEAYKQQGDAARENQNFGMAINYYTNAINMLPYDAAQNLADLYYVRALANDLFGQYERGTSDWQSAGQNYLLCVRNAQDNPQVNVSYDQQMADQLGRLVAWRKKARRRGKLSSNLS